MSKSRFLMREELRVGTNRFAELRPTTSFLRRVWQALHSELEAPALRTAQRARFSLPCLFIRRPAARRSCGVRDDRQSLAFRCFDLADGDPELARNRPVIPGSLRGGCCACWRSILT